MELKNFSIILSLLLIFIVALAAVSANENLNDISSDLMDDSGKYMEDNSDFDEDSDNSDDSDDWGDDEDSDDSDDWGDDEDSDDSDDSDDWGDDEDSDYEDDEDFDDSDDWDDEEGSDDWDGEDSFFNYMSMHLTSSSFKFSDIPKGFNHTFELAAAAGGSSSDSQLNGLDDEKTNENKIDLSENATANPILMLILSLLALFTIPLNKR